MRAMTRKIYKVNETDNPITIDYLRYDTEQTIELANGRQIVDYAIKNVKLIFPFGFKCKPKVGSKALIFITDEDISYALPLDIFSETDLVDINPQIGNFISKNVLKFTDNEIIVDKEGTLKVYINTDMIDLNAKNINLKATEDVKIECANADVKATTEIKLDTVGNISLGAAADKPVALVGSLVDMVPASPTYGQVLSGSSKIKGVL